jgi:8-oxo-dGTP pyrophosphatase MutT (NUDIX family)
MKKEISAGGIVTFGNAILLLRKFNGCWVLPKGKIEAGETRVEAALREVYEESGVHAKIGKYIGEVHYNFRNTRNNEMVAKTVHWYIMYAANMNHTNPQKEEGFVEARYVEFNNAIKIAQYDDERSMIKRAVNLLELNN